MFGMAMGGMEVPPNGEFDIEFRIDCGTLAIVVSLVTIGAGATFTRIQLRRDI